MQESGVIIKIPNGYLSVLFTQYAIITEGVEFVFIAVVWSALHETRGKDRDLCI